MQWRETSSAPIGGRMSAARHVGGVGRFPELKLANFTSLPSVRHQFAELKIELTKNKSLHSPYPKPDSGSAEDAKTEASSTCKVL